MSLIQSIVDYINNNTNRRLMEEKTTKEVAKYFDISTANAYSLLHAAKTRGLIAKLEPLGQNKFNSCGWITVKDTERHAGPVCKNAHIKTDGKCPRCSECGKKVSL